MVTYVRAGVAALMMAASVPAFAGPTFIFTDTGGAGPTTAAGRAFAQAAALWGNVFSNDVTIRLAIGFKPLSNNVLGTTSSARTTLTYQSVRSALIDGATSAADRSSAASLGRTLSFISNEAGNCQTGVNCRPISVSSRTIDNDNTTDNNFISVTTANAKALGLYNNSSLSNDASITFSNNFSWTFDRATGVLPGTYDFVGVAAHEIGHALGYVSGVDLADANVGRNGLDVTAWGTPLDLFRYSNGIRDWTIGTASCTSVDSGRTCLGLMATGAKNGDGQQASHWKTTATPIGLMKATAARGEQLQLTATDLTAYDIIGWNLASGAQNVTIQWNSGQILPPVTAGLNIVAAPEAPMAALFGLSAGLAALLRARRS
jgi:hypothetical protein